jgi:ATP-binding cassette subfamily F protein uup
VARKKTTGRLSYRDQRELDGIEAAIDSAERRKADLERQLQDPATSANPKETLRLSGELEAATAEVSRLYARWEKLQALLG